MAAPAVVPASHWLVTWSTVCYRHPVYDINMMVHTIRCYGEYGAASRRLDREGTEGANLTTASPK